MIINIRNVFTNKALGENMKNVLDDKKEEVSERESETQSKDKKQHKLILFKHYFEKMEDTFEKAKYIWDEYLELVED